MSIISRLTTWSIGQGLKAADLNGEFNNITNLFNNLDAATTTWTNVKTTTLTPTNVGTYTMTGAIAMGTNKITGLGAATTNGDAVRYEQVLTGQIVGTTTNDAASAGNIGEYIASAVTDQASPTSNQFGDLTSVTLGAGDWDVMALGVANHNTAGSVTQFNLGVSTTSGNSATGLVIGDNEAEIAGTVCGGNELVLAVPLTRMSLNTSTTVYLKFLAVYSGSNPHWYGSIKGRRVR